MKRTIAIAAAALSLISSQALADEHRGGDAALGALAGAVVLGPIGAIAGAAVGFTAGPSIAHSWGFRRSGSAARRTRSAQQQTQAPDTRPPRRLRKPHSRRRVRPRPPPPPPRRRRSRAWSEDFRRRCDTLQRDGPQLVIASRDFHSRALSRKNQAALKE
jgi:hypothetical protein